jgi:histidine phosphotransferase ChpT
MSNQTIDTDAALELASLLCSRLCHDLLSPVGALSNGLELLTEEKDPAMRQRCFELLEQSARTSADKLKFFRLAFGAAGGFGESIPTAEPKALIDALVAGKDRLTIHWQVGADALPKPAVKTLLNLSLIAIEALVRGGTVDIAAEVRADGGRQLAEIVVRAAGRASLSTTPSVRRWKTACRPPNVQPHGARRHAGRDRRASGWPVAICAQ